MTGEGMHLPIRLHGGDRVVGLELRELLFRDLGRERAVDRSEKSSRITEMQELFVEVVVTNQSKELAGT